MMPIAIYEALAGDATLNDLGITGDRIFELQSVDERPFANGYWAIVNWQESTVYSQTYTGMANGIPRAPRVMMVWIHTPLDNTRDYSQIDRILNRIDAILLPMIHVIGSDGVRVSCVAKQGRSGNLTDDGWKTTTRNATYGVLYDESAA
jgi:hypothetical protein